MEDSYIYLLHILFIIISVMMWYMYGAISSINEDTISNLKDKNSKKMMKYFTNYHSNLLICVLIYTFIAVSLSFFEKYSYIYNIVLLIVSVLFKHIGYAKAENLNKIIFIICDTLYIVVFPIIFIFTLIINLVAKLIKLDINKEYDMVTEDEIISLVQDGHEQGVLDEEEAKMINNIVELGDKEAMNIMTHRKNVISISIDDKCSDIANVLISNKYSRYPVYDTELDNIKGVLHIRDFFKEWVITKDIADKKLRDVSEIMREAYFIPTTKNVNEIFKEMQDDKNHIAMVIDEYGQLDGIVSMEDIIEEIMGNIFDEYDVDETQLIEQTKNNFLVRGSCLLEELEEKINVDFGEEFETLNGFLIAKLERIPKDDEKLPIIEYGGYKFKIVRIKNKFIQLVKVYKKN